MIISDEHHTSNDAFQKLVDNIECNLYETARFCQNRIVEAVLTTDPIHENRSIEEIDRNLARKEHKKWNDIMNSKDPRSLWKKVEWKGPKEQFQIVIIIVCIYF